MWHVWATQTPIFRGIEHAKARAFRNRTELCTRYAFQPYLLTRKAQNLLSKLVPVCVPSADNVDKSSMTRFDQKANSNRQVIDRCRRALLIVHDAKTVSSLRQGKDFLHKVVLLGCAAVESAGSDDQVMAIL